jgi:phosphoglycolate phosphatase-like HAD superfamily hydrolase
VNNDRGPSRISTVLFDLDDTIIDSYAARVQALKDVFSTGNILSPTPEQFLHEIRGGQFEGGLKQLETKEGRDLDLFGSYNRFYWNKEPGLIGLYPGIKLVIQKLEALGIKLGIVTQKEWAFELEGRKVGASQELLELGMIDLFPVGVGFESVSKHKPHPEGIFLALEQLVAQASETIVVGDSLADMKAAQAAGCWSCHAVWGITNPEHSLGKVEVDLVAEMPEALLKLLLI